MLIVACLSNCIPFPVSHRSRRTRTGAFPRRSQGVPRRWVMWPREPLHRSSARVSLRRPPPTNPLAITRVLAFIQPRADLLSGVTSLPRGGASSGRSSSPPPPSSPPLPAHRKPRAPAADSPDRVDDRDAASLVILVTRVVSCLVDSGRATVASDLYVVLRLCIQFAATKLIPTLH